MTMVFRALSALLTYPETPLHEAIPEIRAALLADDLLDAGQRACLEPLLTSLAEPDLIAAQEHYVETFDRGRAHCLHLFEHVHGESRDRGQAMVDLRERYLAAGLDPATNELPDYLPLFLEYCSVLPIDEALGELAEPGTIIATLAGRLAQRGSPYAGPLSILSDLAGAEPVEVPPQAVADPDLQDFAALDAQWEEQEITFGAMAPAAPATSQDCPPARDMIARFLDLQPAAEPARSH